MSLLEPPRVHQHEKLNTPPLEQEPVLYGCDALSASHAGVMDCVAIARCGKLSTHRFGRRPSNGAVTVLSQSRGEPLTITFMDNLNATSNVTSSSRRIQAPSH